MNSNYQSGIEFMDFLNLVAFYIQLINIEQGSQESEYIHNVIQVIAKEIELLHKENDKIMAQNEEIIRLLREG